MEFNMELPYITGENANDQVSQIKSYLFQLVQQLQWAFSTVDSNGTKSSSSSLEELKEKKDIAKEKTPVQRFHEIKSLIIKSSDIAESYYEIIDNLISTSGKYTASSVFGTFQEEVSQRIGADHESILLSLERLETVNSSVAEVGNWLKQQQAYLRYGTVGTTLDDSGLASTTAPGIEIGDYQVMEGGTESKVNKRFARFTAYGLELFGGSMDTAPVAYIKQNKLYITNAEITQSLKVGGFSISSSNGLSFDWVGVD